MPYVRVKQAYLCEKKLYLSVQNTRAWMSLNKCVYAHGTYDTYT